MGRRKGMRGIAKDRIYTTRMAARIAGVSEPTLRKWGRNGLHIIRDRRPHLVRGADLIDHMGKMRAARKRPMARDQMYCTRCKGPSDPLHGAVTYTPCTAMTGRLGGVCTVCGARMGRFCGVSELAGLAKKLAVQIRERAQA